MASSKRRKNSRRSHNESNNDSSSSTRSSRSSKSSRSSRSSSRRRKNITYYVKEQLYDKKGKIINNRFHTQKGNQPNHLAYQFAKKMSFKDHVSLVKMGRVIVVYNPKNAVTSAYFVYLIHKNANTDIPRKHLQPIIKKIKKIHCLSLEEAQDYVFAKKPKK